MEPARPQAEVPPSLRYKLQRVGVLTLPPPRPARRPIELRQRPPTERLLKRLPDIATVWPSASELDASPRQRTPAIFRPVAILDASLSNSPPTVRLSP